MKEIFERLGLVIHWSGFIIGCGISVVAISVLFDNSSLENLEVLGTIGIIFSAPFLAMTPAWAIRFIITGNKTFYPWRN